MKPPSPKADALRALRERHYEELMKVPRKDRSLVHKPTLAKLDKAIKEASAKVAKPKKSKRHK